jgi:hypothetical protein
MVLGSIGTKGSSRPLVSKITALSGRSSQPIDARFSSARRISGVANGHIGSPEISGRRQWARRGREAARSRWVASQMR